MLWVYEIVSFMYSSSLNWIPNSIFCIFLLFCFFFVYLHYFILFHIFNSADFSLSVAFVCSAVCSAMRIHIYVAWELVFRLWRSDFTDDKNNHQWNIKLLCGYATKFTKYLIYILFVVNFFSSLSLALWYRYCCCYCWCGFLLLLGILAARWWCTYVACKACNSCFSITYCIWE